jgi:hypothetical protein
MEPTERFLPVGGLHEPVAVSEGEAHERAQVRIVLADEDGLGGVGSGFGSHDGQAADL